MHQKIQMKPAALPSGGAEARLLSPAVMIAALGYFVDIYDLVLFSMLRNRSLQDLGYQGDALLQEGSTMFNWQMIGMLLGGLLWGILGDKKGRLSTLYGSIIMYSIANLANGAVDSLFWYGFWRLIAGIGLAGELGVGITLVAETAPKHKRGLATAIVAGLGLSGALLAGLAVAYLPSWRWCYYSGGILGFLLLALRIGANESGLFHQTRDAGIARGNFLLLFRDLPTFTRYLRCILVGLPVWFVVGILMTNAKEMGLELGAAPVDPVVAVPLCYAGQIFGDLGSGLFSQWLQNRKRVMLFYLVAGLVFTFVFRYAYGASAGSFYAICFALGLGAGYWILFTTMSSEQFGTNIRATVTTTVPNFVRGSLVPMNMLFLTLKDGVGLLDGALYTGVIVYAIALAGWVGMQDTFHRDMDFVESAA